MEKYVLKDRLGEGSYGVVWKATNETNTLAIKIISGVNYFLKE
jgi:serine/threonine protein kinase